MKTLIVALLLAAAAFGAETDRRSPGYKSYERANALFVEKRFAECSAAIEEALRLDPKLVPALTLQAKLAMAANRFDLAAASLERALAADPAAAYAQFLYGFQFYLANDLERARPQLEKARRLNPADPRGALYLGLTLESLGQTDAALPLYREAVRLERASGGAQAATLLAGFRLLLLLGRTEECETWIKDALKADTRSRDAHYEFARFLLRQGDAGQSAAEGETALRLSDGATTDNQIHYLLTRAYRGRDPDAAARHAEALRAGDNR